LATFAPIAETVCSISEPKYGGVDVIDFPKENVHHRKHRRQAKMFPMVNIAGRTDGHPGPDNRAESRTKRLTRQFAVG
jgi:hypothetical protein